MALLRTSRVTGSKLLRTRLEQALPALGMGCVPQQHPVLARSVAAGPTGAVEHVIDSHAEKDVGADTMKLQKLQREISGLRKDVKKLSMMLEQDFIGYRRSPSKGEKEGESAWWRSSLQGAAPLTDVGTGTVEESDEDPLRREEVRPSVQTAKMQPTHISEMGHSQLAMLAVQGNHFAHRERIIREIMSVDDCSWEKAHDSLYEMDEYKERYYWYVTMPYRVGIVLATFFGIGSGVLVFHPSVAYWYGTEIAGESLPDDMTNINDLTINQVGSWTWQWMEPMIGTASFMLLCAQFMRAQFLKLQMKTFLEVMESRKATMLANKFPKYDRSMMRTWAKPLPTARPNFFPIYERSTGLRGPSSGL